MHASVIVTWSKVNMRWQAGREKMRTGGKFLKVFISFIAKLFLTLFLKTLDLTLHFQCPSVIKLISLLCFLLCFRLGTSLSSRSLRHNSSSPLILLHVIIQVSYVRESLDIAGDTWQHKVVYLLSFVLKIMSV